MKQFFIKKEITAVIFIISLVTFSVINCIYSWPFLKEELTSTISTQDIETKMNNDLYQKKFIHRELWIYTIRIRKKRI